MSRILNITSRFVLGILCLLWLVCISLPVRALDTDKTLAQCRLDVWTTKDGLPPDTINAMAQTPDGYLWLATGAGLVRFDGVTFQKFDSRNTPGLRRSNITALMVAHDGTLWIGTDGAGFGPFRNGIFTPCQTGIKDESWSLINAMLEAQDGTFWVGGGGEHNLLHYQNGRFTKLPNDYAFVQSIVQDFNGALWGATQFGGLYVHRPHGTEDRFNTIEGLPTKNLTCMALDRDSSLWIGTADSGLYHYAEGKFTTYTTRDGLSANEINALRFDRQGNLWIGTRIGLDRFQGGKFSTFRKIDGLHDVGVSAIFEDREGNLWVGSGTGLNRFRNTRLTPLSFVGAEGLTNTTALAQGLDGSLWFGTDGGLKRLRNGAMTTYTTRDGLPGNTVNALHIARDGALWIITSGGCISRWDGRQFHIVVPKSLWRVLGEDSEGLVLADQEEYARLRGSKIVPLTHTGASGFVFNSFLDAAGTLWFTSSGGLAVLRHNHVTVINQGFPPGAHILSIAQAGNGCLWIGSDKGLIRYENGSVFVYGLSCGLPDDNLFNVLTDTRGALWIGGSRGIFSVAVADLERYRSGQIKTIPAHLYETGDGIRSLPTREQALRTFDNRLVFLGMKGATIVEPDHLKANHVPPPVVIERVTIDKKAVDMRSTVPAPPCAGDLEIHYTGLNFSDAENVTFRYQLEGYDKDWIEAGTRRIASYTNLPPGSYRFHVLAGNSDGAWNNAGASYKFTLTPFFYQTPGFKAACVGLLCLVTFALIRLSLYQLHRSNQRLEAKVAERTEELHRSKQQIEATNRRLQALATTDGMTGLANHRAFQERLRSELSCATETLSSLSLLLIDVDRFKAYNDSFGHPAGDEVLRRVARLIRENVRAEDYAARYGGEEFAVLLPRACPAKGFEAAERIRKAVAEYPFPHGRVTLSVGVAWSEDGATAPEHLVELADEALYKAKDAGRNRVVSASSEAMSEAPPGALLPPSVPLQLADGDPLLSLFQQQDGHILSGIMALLSLRDPQTDGHSHRVIMFALRLAQEVIRQDRAEFCPNDLRDLTFGALLHDIGKIGVPDAILFKPGALTDAEWEIIRTHPEQGAKALQAFSQFVCALPVVRSHHERWDGTGYPQGLAGERIPLVARLFAIVDTLDAMSSDRPYRAASPYDKICAEIRQMAGKQFDPVLVEAFLAIPEADWERLRGQAAGGAPYIRIADGSPVLQAV